MAYKYGVVLRTNQVAQIQASVGASGTLKIFSGAEPANCAAADPSGLLCTITLPATFLTSTNGVTTIAGTWQAVASAGGSGTNAQSFRMYDGASVCHVQGDTITDMVLNNQSIATGQTVTVTQFSVTAGNA
jgi:hypothetical protein